MLTQGNNYYYYDDYMYFTFNGVHSSKYNLFIQNDTEDLKLNISTGAKLEFTSPKYQTGQYLLGATHPQRELPQLKLVANNLTRAQCLEIAKWLKPGTQGAFKFDYAPDWEYDAVVSSISEPNLYAQDNNKYIFTTEVKFVTTSSPYARTSSDAVLEITDKSESFLSKEPGTNELTEISLGDNRESFNHIIGLPSVLLYDKKIEDEGEYSGTPHYVYRIHHFGDGESIVYIDFFYPVTVDKDNNIPYGLYTMFLSVVQKNLSFKNENKISIQYKQTASVQNHIVKYAGSTNLFFVDNLLPQQAKFNNELENLAMQYYPETFNLDSPGPLTEILNEDHFEQLIDTPYSWFICVPGQYEDGSPFFEVTPKVELEESEYPAAVESCKILYDSQIDLLKLNIQDLINNNKCYFGFYSEIDIYHSCTFIKQEDTEKFYHTLEDYSTETTEETAEITCEGRFSGSIKVREYTEAF
jgi:hypothetical protein